MKLGLVADIHEHVDYLRLALRRFRQEGVDQVVVLGDVFDMGERIEETCRLLAQADAIGVWGNHELGLYHRPAESVRSRYAGPVLDFMDRLHARLEVGDYLFTHGLPFWEATDPAVYYLGERPEDPEAQAGTFALFPHWVFLVGHFHRWLIATPGGCLPWDGDEPFAFTPGGRYLVVVAAVCDGWAAVLDTRRQLLLPCRLCPPAV